MSAAPTAQPPRDSASAADDVGSAGARHAGPPRLVMKRTGWDVLLGLLLIATGAFVLGDVAIASVVSVLFVGWTLLLGGAFAVVQVVDGLLLLLLGRHRLTT